MYANVAIDNGAATTEITLPQAAITYNPYGNTVFVVEKNVVHQRFVKLGDTRGDQVAVKSGLAAGDVVVTAGQMKLRNGSAVVVNNKIEPNSDASPVPPNE
jgi:membrane fusion protein (multidrug efflux system)